MLKAKLAAALVFSAAAATQVLAQDSRFLACGQLSDRGQRIACLEDALEAASPSDNATSASPAMPPAAAVPAEPVPSAPATAAQTAPATRPATAVPDVSDPEPSLLERLRNFGQNKDASVSSDDAGQDQLHDTITKLEKRNNLWLVTLSSGQVWSQQIPRTFNLREGDEISIYQGGIGNGYRLAAARLSGFIRVERVQ